MAVPYVFIGCASEALPEAEQLRTALKDRLQNTALIEASKDEGAFEAGSVLIKKLQEKAVTVDFAVLLLTPTEHNAIAPIAFEPSARE